MSAETPNRTIRVAGRDWLLDDSLCLAVGEPPPPPSWVREHPLMSVVPEGVVEGLEGALMGADDLSDPMYVDRRLAPLLRAGDAWKRASMLNGHLVIAYRSGVPFMFLAERRRTDGQTPSNSLRVGADGPEVSAACVAAQAVSSIPTCTREDLQTLSELVLIELSAMRPDLADSIHSILTDRLEE